MPDLTIGTLLVAAPPLGDRNFDRTVVLICEHSDEGSFGIVLNRSTPLTLGEVHPDFVGLTHRLDEGGPVQPETLHLLHRHADLGETVSEVVPGVFWGGNAEELVGALRSGGKQAEGFRLFLGYAGWSAGQLEDEVEVGGWILHPGAARHVFPDDPARLWSHVMREMGGEYALLANFPEDPRLN